VGTSYSSDSADVQNIPSFIFHELSAGSNKEWRYGNGSIAASGAITMNSEKGPSGSVTPRTGVKIYSSNGVITMSGGDMDSFNGFLSDDKKTIAGTYTDSDGNNKLMIIQINSRNNYAPGDWSGISAAYLIAGGVQNFWFHFTATVDGSGKMAISDSAGYDLDGKSLDTSISSAGVVTITGLDSHGQMSDDGKFVVFTETLGDGSGIYTLFVFTK
jgi:hypothetical protein